MVAGSDLRLAAVLSLVHGRECLAHPRIATAHSPSLKRAGRPFPAMALSDVPRI